ncbi:adenylate kinase, partial [Cymbomonas tetramitiformis]
ALKNATGKSKVDTLFVHVLPADKEELQQRMQAELMEAESTVSKRIEHTALQIQKANANTSLFDHILIDEGDQVRDEVELCWLRLSLAIRSPAVSGTPKGRAWLLRGSGIPPAKPR